MKVGIEMKKKTRKNLAGTLVYHFLVLLVGLVMIYPLVWMLMSSFKPTETVMNTAGQLIPQQFTLVNYSNGWRGFSDTSFLVFFRCWRRQACSLRRRWSPMAWRGCVSACVMRCL